MQDSSLTYSGDFVLWKHDGAERRVKHGRGIMRWPDGREYRGQFHFDKMQGEGIMSWPTGSKYVGQYCNNRKEGNGKLTMPDGSIYEGTFVEGLRHGSFLHTAADGSAFRMEFDLDHVISKESIHAFERVPAGSCVGDWTFEPCYDVFTKSEEPTDGIANECSYVADKAQCSAPTCCICLSDLSYGDTCCETACKHVFHKECIDAWVRQKNHCPLCVRKIPLCRVDRV
jgi:hypothetical protein